jgi:hypothetical protein
MYILLDINNYKYIPVYYIYIYSLQLYTYILLLLLLLLPQHSDVSHLS